MSFLKWISEKISPPKARIELTLQKGKFSLDEQVRGQLEILSEEEFDVNQLIVWLTCNECVKKIRTESNQYGTRQTEYWDSAVIYRTSAVIFGVAHVPQGFNASYPFALPIPTAARETHYSLDRNVKWFLFSFLDVKRRPSIQTETYEVLVERQQISQPSSPVLKEVVREVVLISCTYCGSLMPQTAIFCPHCGARRKT